MCLKSFEKKADVLLHMREVHDKRNVKPLPLKAIPILPRVGNLTQSINVSEPTKMPEVIITDLTQSTDTKDTSNVTESTKMAEGTITKSAVKTVTNDKEVTIMKSENKKSFCRHTFITI